MNKEQFIKKMAQIGNIKKVEAERITKLFFDTLFVCLQETEKIIFVGFGNFEVKTTKERKGRNPKTGNECIIPKRKVLKFKASEKMIEEMNKLGETTAIKH